MFQNRATACFFSVLHTHPQAIQKQTLDRFVCWFFFCFPQDFDKKVSARDKHINTKQKT